MVPSDPQKRSPREGLGRRISNWFADLVYFVNQVIGKAADYFEWTAHRCFEGISSIFSGIGSLFLTTKVIDEVRKTQAIRASDLSERVTTEGANVLERCEYYFHQFTSGVGSVFGGLYQLFVPAQLIDSTEKAVASKTADALWDIRDRLEKIGERMRPNG